MAKHLDAVLNNALQGNNVTCTLSPNSVQVILFALSFVENDDAWKDDYFDTVTDAESDQIRDIVEKVTREILP